MIRTGSSLDKPIKYLVLFLLMAQSSIPFFFGDLHLVIATGITAFIFVTWRKRFDKVLLNLLLFFSILMLLQAAAFSMFQFQVFLGILARITYAYMAIKIIGPDFSKYFVNLLYGLSLIALVFWVVLSFVPGAYQTALGISNFVIPFELYPHDRNNLILYTNEYWLLANPPRNAGPFWEPGGFGVFLLIGMTLNTLLTRQLFNKKNVVFLIAAITTFSLGTYISLFVFLMLYLILVKKVIKGYAFPLLAIVISLSTYSYFEFEFLRDKLVERERKTDLRLNENATYGTLKNRVGRNAQARLDMRDFYKSPIVGTGVFQTYEFGASASGLTSILRLWGIVGALVIMLTMYYSFKRFCQFYELGSAYAMLATGTCMIVAVAQSLYGKPFFLGLIFIYLVTFKVVKTKN